MKYIIFSLSFIICILLCSLAFAQDFDRYGTTEKHFQKYVKIAEREGINSQKRRIFIEYCYKNKINIAKVQEFKKMGIDLIPLLSSYNNSNYERAALMAPIVVRGVVISRNYDTREKVQFHTTLKVEIKEIINKGNYDWSPKDNKYISIKLRTGMVRKKTTPPKSYYLDSPHQPKYLIGEEVLLFLDPVKDMVKTRKNFINRLGGEKKYKEEEFQTYIEDRFGIEYSEIKHTFTVRSKYSIMHNYVMSNTSENIGSIKSVTERTRKIITLNNIEGFLKL